jgi:hypothetical protein
MQQVTRYCSWGITFVVRRVYACLPVPPQYLLIPLPCTSNTCQMQIHPDYSNLYFWHRSITSGLNQQECLPLYYFNCDTCFHVPCSQNSVCVCVSHLYHNCLQKSVKGLQQRSMKEILQMSGNYWSLVPSSRKE